MIEIGYGDSDDSDERAIHAALAEAKRSHHTGNMRTIEKVSGKRSTTGLDRGVSEEEAHLRRRVIRIRVLPLVNRTLSKRKSRSEMTMKGDTANPHKAMSGCVRQSSIAIV